MNRIMPWILIPHEGRWVVLEAWTIRPGLELEAPAGDEPDVMAFIEHMHALWASEWMVLEEVAALDEALAPKGLCVWSVPPLRGDTAPMIEDMEGGEWALRLPRQLGVGLHEKRARPRHIYRLARLPDLDLEVWAHELWAEVARAAGAPRYIGGLAPSCAEWLEDARLDRVPRIELGDLERMRRRQTAPAKH